MSEQPRVHKTSLARRATQARYRERKRKELATLKQAVAEIGEEPPKRGAVGWQAIQAETDRIAEEEQERRRQAGEPEPEPEPEPQVEGQECKHRLERCVTCHGYKPPKPLVGEARYKALQRIKRRNPGAAGRFEWYRAG